MGDLKKLTNLLTNYNKIRSEILNTAGDMAVTEFTLNFRKQGFNGVKWKPKKKPNGKNILIKKGNLRRSISKKRISNDSIVIGSDLPYAYIHNNGGTINRKERSEIFTRNRYTKGNKKGKFKKGTKSGKGFSFKSHIVNMPKRQFMGNMPTLTKKITNFIKNKLNNLNK
jgi:phage gpG-like protein